MNIITSDLITSFLFLSAIYAFIFFFFKEKYFNKKTIISIYLGLASAQVAISLFFSASKIMLPEMIGFTFSAIIFIFLSKNPD